MVLRRTVSVGVALGLACVVTGHAAHAQSEEDPRTAAKFLQGLRDRGYFDLAAEYLEFLRKQPDAPAELAETIDYEIGRLLIDEASKSGDLVRRKELLDQARGRLDAFTKAHPKHAKSTDALMQLGRLLLERGSVAYSQSDDTANKTEKDLKLAEARGSFKQARAAYETAGAEVKEAYKKFPSYIPENTPASEQRDQTQNSLMQARLQRGLVDYEEGQTYPLASKERTELMTAALKQFELVYNDYRTQFAGLTARMMQAKCFEERGDVGPAIGIYKELLEHPDPRLRPLQRHVAYFKIIALAKRKEFALAADEADQWLRANNTNELLHSREGLGVQFELAKDLAAQLPEVPSEKVKDAATKRIIDLLGQVVRFASPFKSEALAMLKKYKPSAAASAGEVARLTYEDALSQGEQAIAGREWDHATALLKQAIRRAETARDVDKTNMARHNLIYVYYMDKKYYEAAVLADHLARRYPRAGLSSRSAEIGMAALAEAYNTYTKVDRASDLSNLIDLAQYTAETYPDQDQGDKARLTLGQIYHGMGRYDEAVKAYESVRAKSPVWAEARTRSGATHWKRSVELRNDGKTAEADKETARALAVLEEALKGRRESGAAATDPGLIGNACDIADILLETAKPQDALKLLDPIAGQATSTTGPASTRLAATRLRAHITLDQFDQALVDMTALEMSPTDSALTQLYFGLGKLIDKKMESLKKMGDRRAAERAEPSYLKLYLKLLNAVATSKSGQTLESLLWAGDNLLTHGQPVVAEGVYRRILESFAKDEKFLAQPAAKDHLLLIRLKLAASLREQKNFAEAESLISQVAAENPKKIEPMLARGQFLEAKAEATPGRDASAKKAAWSTAYAEWRVIGTRLGNLRTKPTEFFESWYHAALALQKAGRATEARQTLAGIMRLSPSVGGPEMREKYKALLAQIPSSPTASTLPPGQGAARP